MINRRGIFGLFAALALPKPALTPARFVGLDLASRADVTSVFTVKGNVIVSVHRVAADALHVFGEHTKEVWYAPHD